MPGSDRNRNLSGYPTRASVRVYQPRQSFHAPLISKPTSLRSVRMLLVCELVTILGVNGFALHEVKIKVRVLDTYMPCSCTLSRCISIRDSTEFQSAR
jgi:hypothetical protein